MRTFTVTALSQEDEVRIAIAGSIRDVCQAKPASGVDLVGLMSSILSKDTNAIPVALAIEALTLLCQ